MQRSRSIPALWDKAATQGLLDRPDAVVQEEPTREVAAVENKAKLQQRLRLRMTKRPMVRKDALE